MTVNDNDSDNGDDNNFHENEKILQFKGDSKNDDDDNDAMIL